MPDMDGFELARAIKADPRIAGVNLILLTSSVYAEMALRLGLQESRHT